MIQHLKIGSRLAFGFCLILLLATAILLIGLWRMAELEASSEYVIDQKVAAMTSAMRPIRRFFCSRLRPAMEAEAVAINQSPIRTIVIA